MMLRQEQKVLSIGQEAGPAVRGVQCRVRRRYLFRLSTCYRHTPESAIDIGSEENCLAGPRSPSSIVGGRKNERRPSRNIDSLKVPIREESNRLSVGRP